MLARRLPLAVNVPLFHFPEALGGRVAYWLSFEGSDVQLADALSQDHIGFGLDALSDQPQVLLPILLMSDQVAAAELTNLIGALARCPSRSACPQLRIFWSP